MTRLVQIKAFVVQIARSVIVHAAKDDVARIGTRAHRVKQRGERHAAPLPDRAPAFYTVVPGDLRPLRHTGKLRKVESARLLDRAMDDETVGSKVAREQSHVLRIRRR